MPVLPANFFTRTELQRLLVRADELLHATQDGELAYCLRQLLTGAANLDGVLAELPVTPHPVNKALENPNNWASAWVGGSCSVHTHKGRFRIEYGQQVLKRPNGDVIGTSRYRIRIGDGEDAEEYTSCDRTNLRNVAFSYLSKFEDTPADNVRDVLLRLFGAHPRDDEGMVDALAELPKTKEGS